MFVSTMLESAEHWVIRLVTSVGELTLGPFQCVGSWMGQDGSG